MQDADRLFWELIETHWDSLWRFSLGLTTDWEDAKDLMSETVLAAHKSFVSLRNPVAFQSFCFTIAHRLYKRKKWRRKIFGNIEEAHDRPFEASTESSHDLELLLKALEQLPEKQREAILLFEISGLSLEEIRQIQGGSLSAVKQRLSRGREGLRAALRDRDLASDLPSHSYFIPQST